MRVPCGPGVARAGQGQPPQGSASDRRAAPRLLLLGPSLHPSSPSLQVLVPSQGAAAVAAAAAAALLLRVGGCGDIVDTVCSAACVHKHLASSQQV